MARIFKSGYGATINIENDLELLLGEAVAKLEDLSVPMREISVDLAEGVRINFATRGRGAWVPIAESTIRRHGPSVQPLFRPELAKSAGVLRDSITSRSTKFQARAISQHPLAHIHDRGTKHFKTGKTHVPERKFMFVPKGYDEAAAEKITKYVIGE